MEFITTHHELATVIAIIGNVDALTADQVTRHLHGELNNGHAMLIADLSEVAFMSSAGLRAILTTLKESRKQGGDFRLASVQPGVEKILKLSGFTNILKIYPSLDQALSDLPA